MRTRITFFVIAILTLNFFISSNTILYGQVPNDGLVAWWTFEEGTGTITYDKSGNGHNGTLNGASWVSGGVEFLLNTQYVKFEDTPFRLAEGTWQVLINVKDFNMAWGYGSIVEKDYTNWNNDGRLVVLNNGKIQFDIDDKSTSSTKSIVSTDPIPLNTDIEIVASWGQQGMKLYINKLLVGTNPHKGEITSSIGRPLTAGSNFVGTRSFIGIVKDLKVYNKYLLENVPGLMAYYPFNGNAYDMSGNGNNGNASEVTFAEEGTRKVAQFTTSSYVEVPDNSSLDFSSVAGVTFAVWIKQEQSSMGDIFRKMGNSGSSDDEYALGINATGQLSGAFNGPGQQKTFQSKSSLSLNNWNHVVFMWNQTDSKISYYINGVLDTSTVSPITSIQNTNVALRIGHALQSYLNSFIGSLDDIRIYNRTLSDQEISDLYNGGGGTGGNQISGNVKDVKVSLKTGSIDYQPLVAEITLFDGTNLVGSTNSDASGNFVFNNVAQGNYILELKKTGQVPNSYEPYTVKSTYQVSAGQSLTNLELPFSLIGLERKLVDSLENISLKYDIVLGLVPIKVKIDGYDIEGADLLHNKWNNIVSEYEQINNSLLRLLLAENTQRAFLDDANVMSVETIKSLFQIGNTLISIYSIQNKIHRLTDSKLIQKTTDAILNLAIKTFKGITTLALQRIPPPNGPELSRVTSAMFDATELLVSDNMGQDLLEEALEELFAIKGSELMLEKLYIPKWTQSILDDAVLRSENFNYTGSFEDAYTHYNNSITSHSESTNNIQNVVENLRNISGIAAAGASYVDVAGNIAALTGVGTALTGILKTISIILKSVSVASVVGAITTSGLEFIKNPTYLYAAETKIFKPDYVNNYILANTFQRMEASKIAIELKNKLVLSNDDYTNLLTNLLYNITNGNRSVALSQIETLVQLDLLLNKDTDNLMYPIYAVSSFSDNLIDDFETLYNENGETIFNSYAARQKLYAELLNYCIDSTNVLNIDSTEIAGQNAIEANNSMLTSISNLSATLQNITKPAFVVSTDLIYPKTVINGTNFNINLKYKNYGDLTIDSLYLTVEATGGYTYNENLIYLGRLNAGQEDSINIYMTAPLSDTTGYFNLSYVGHNVYSIPSSGILITSNATNINFEKAIPTEFVLHQNYPNPFNPTTKISYSLPKTSLVQLKIFNLLGQEIRTIVTEEKSAGNYEVNFDASELPSGVYIYKIKAGEYLSTKKMILLK